jgi:hypothetical protein
LQDLEAFGREMLERFSQQVVRCQPQEERLQQMLDGAYRPQWAADVLEEQHRPAWSQDAPSLGDGCAIVGDAAEPPA